MNDYPLDFIRELMNDNQIDLNKREELIKSPREMRINFVKNILFIYSQKKRKTNCFFSNKKDSQ